MSTSESGLDFPSTRLRSGGAYDEMSGYKKQTKKTPRTSSQNKRTGERQDGGSSADLAYHAGQEIVKNVSHLVIPFALLIAKKGADSYVDNSDLPPASSSSSLSDTRRRSTAAGGSAAADRRRSDASSSSSTTAEKTRKMNNKIPRSRGGADVTTDTTEEERGYLDASMNGGGTKNKARMNAQFNRLTMQLNQLFGGAHERHGK